ncbi:CD82 antigen [Sinocyclocheilus anshuiensis]|uniref:CD82 antigen n=1 Tax=Sinocyclocheilus anshuiensis TaxID=1608454 RepID=UPI0007B92D6E|nr:PREDICTED: CD82 antigen-like [Sinocyclocheilus anshuiensis]XP_016302983.1 PREDICTED: CD82 antigen-like [Sinocyclocheilus anshuiensis]XP_016302984.1 PREDICTED: CD82 antigen-like [Sinocyclocheilus anshuiensis]
MKADDKLQILKFFLMLVNSFFVILGISIFACSAWILFDKDSFVSVLSSGQEVKVVAGGLFFIGLVVVFVSLLGCAGAYFESRCFIIFYMCFLIVIILGQLFITFVLLIRRDKIEQFLRDNVDEIIREYGGNETQTSWKLLDSVQTSAQCCGRLTSNEWRNNTFIESWGETDIYPCSCFNGTCPVILPGTHSFGNGSDIYETGCEKVLVDWLEMNIIVIFGMDVGLLLIQILQFIFGVQTFKCIGRKTRELHPNNLLNAMEENPAAQPEPQQYSMENQQFDTQTYDPQMDNGYYHHGGYVDGNYDQCNNPEFYEPDNRQMYNSHHNLQYQQSYNGSYDQGYMQHQSYNPDDY